MTVAIKLTEALNHVKISKVLDKKTVLRTAVTAQDDDMETS